MNWCARGACARGACRRVGAAERAFGCIAVRHFRDMSRHVAQRCGQMRVALLQSGEMRRARAQHARAMKWRVR
eukprot:9726665-Lingulodinium_polyedra.AAC.1